MLLPICVVSLVALTQAAVTDKACPFKPADIIFVLDGSGSEGTSNFRKQLAFISNFTKQFEVGPNNTRVALVTFGTTVSNQFYLNQLNTKDAVLQRINTTHYPNGETNTHLALDFVAKQTLSQRHDGRNASKIVIVLTDGQSLEPTLTKQAAAGLKHNRLVEVIAIGIGDKVDATELAVIASDRNHTFRVASFDALSTIQTELTQETCGTCKSDLSDICFVLDTSGSEGRANFMKQLEFVNLMVNEFEIDGQSTQICLITFGTSASTEIHLDSFRTKTGLMENVLKVPYRDGETRTDMGLSNANNELFHQRHHGSHDSSSRQGSNKVVIVLTDGRSTEPHLTQSQAHKLQQNGVDMFAIGIGRNVDSSELNIIASDKDHVFQVHQFSELYSIHQNVVNKICAKSALMTTLPPTTPTTTLPPTTTKAACGLKPADIVFVLDSSDSEGADNFKTEVDFVYQFAAQFSIGTNNVQFSVVTFSSLVRNDFYFNTYNSRNAVLHAIRNISYIGQGTNTSAALSHVRTENLQPKYGARSNSSKYVIVITDGRSDEPDQTKKEATALHALANVISIGIGPKVDKSELSAIASNHHAVQVDSFALLNSIKSQLTDLACANA